MKKAQRKLRIITKYGPEKFINAFEEIVNRCKNITRKNIKIEEPEPEKEKGLVESIFSPKAIIENRPEVIESYPKVLKLLAKYGFGVSLLIKERQKSVETDKNTDNKGADTDERN